MSQQLSIFHFVPAIKAEEGGVVKAVVDLSQEMASRGHRVLVATFDDSDAPRTWRDSQDKVPRILQLSPPLPGRRLTAEDLAKLSQTLMDYQVGHLHTPWEMGNIQLAKLFCSLGLPYVFSVHGMLDDWSMQQKTLKKRLFLKLFGRQFLRRAALVHYTAEGERFQAQKWVPQSVPAFVQALALDTQPYLDLPGPDEARSAFKISDPGVPKILYLSRLHPKKGLELLIQAVAHLHRSGRPVELLIAGPGEKQYEQSLQNMASQMGIAPSTRFLGMVNGSLKFSLYQTASVFVLPTYQENFGLVLVEALACGTPVVTTRGTDIWPELQAAGAEIVDFSPQEIAAAIDRTIADIQANRELGQQGRQYVLDWLSSDRVAQGYEAMYNQAINQQPAT